MIDILLATYNGARFLPEQLDSILNQDHSDWRILIRDAGSKDDTKSIIGSYARKFPEKIIVLDSDVSSPACENYSVLLAGSSADYVMFCDQDDIWFPNKISACLSKMKDEEDRSGQNFPILVFTDKQVVDENLSLISKSFFKYQNLDPAKNKLNHLLVQNVVSGCTVMINRALINSCGSISKAAIMHDHWLALAAAAFGKIVFLNLPTLLYRQHGKNNIGALKYDLFYFIKKLGSGIPAARARFYMNAQQAKAFASEYRKRLKPADFEVLESFGNLEELNWFQRRRMLWQKGIFKTGLIRNAGMFLIV